MYRGRTHVPSPFPAREFANCLAVSQRGIDSYRERTWVFLEPNDVVSNAGYESGSWVEQPVSNVLVRRRVHNQP